MRKEWMRKFFENGRHLRGWKLAREIAKSTLIMRDREGD